MGLEASMGIFVLKPDKDRKEVHKSELKHRSKSLKKGKVSENRSSRAAFPLCQQLSEWPMRAVNKISPQAMRVGLFKSIYIYIYVLKILRGFPLSICLQSLIIKRHLKEFPKEFGCKSRATKDSSHHNRMG